MICAWSHDSNSCLRTPRGPCWRTVLAVAAKTIVRPWVQYHMMHSHTLCMALSQENVQRLKAYRSNLVIFPRNVKKPKVRVAGVEGRDGLQRRTGHTGHVRGWQRTGVRGGAWTCSTGTGAWTCSRGSGCSRGGAQLHGV